MSLRILDPNAPPSEFDREDFAITLLPPELSPRDIEAELLDIAARLEWLPSNGALHAVAQRLREISIPALSKPEFHGEVPSDLIGTAEHIEGIGSTGPALLLARRLRLTAAAAKLMNRLIEEDADWFGET